MKPRFENKIAEGKRTDGVDFMIHKAGTRDFLLQVSEERWTICGKKEHAGLCKVKTKQTKS